MRLRWAWWELLLEKYLPKPDYVPEFISHLEELRKRLLICIVTLVFSTVISYFFSRQILNFLIHPIEIYKQTDLIFQKPYEAFFAHIKAAALCGFVVSSPILFFQMWMFIKPGLYRHEKRLFSSLVTGSIALFLIGAAFAYYAVIPFGLQFLLSYETENIKPYISIGAYFSFLIGMVIAFGFLFDFPLILIGLVKAGVLRCKTLKKSRKVIIVMIFVLAAVLTPSPDPISQILLALPLLLLFEISLFIAQRVEGAPRAGLGVDTRGN